MFDLGIMELLVIGVVALIVVGPEDLPKMFRAAGRITGKMKGMAREFSRAMNDAADQTGMRETADDLKKMTSPRAMGMDALKDATSGLTDLGPETSRLSEERRAQAEKIREHGAKVAQARLDREAAERAAAEAADAPPAKAAGE
ncbi:MAG: Sec-independent protein translocase protein TatB [Hasllibacter sp.]